MIHCSQAELLISLRVDGELPAEAAGDLEEHLRRCPSCAALLGEEESLSNCLRRATAVPESSLRKLGEEVLGNVRHASRTSPPAGFPSSARRSLPWIGLAAAAAAAFVAGWSVYATLWGGGEERAGPQLAGEARSSEEPRDGAPSGDVDGAPSPVPALEPSDAVLVLERAVRERAYLPASGDQTLELQTVRARTLLLETLPETLDGRRYREDGDGGAERFFDGAPRPPGHPRVGGGARGARVYPVGLELENVNTRLLRYDHARPWH